MIRIFAVILAIAAMRPVRAADQTWTGTISDEVCGASHRNMASATGISDRECTIQCARSGAKYVLVNEKEDVIPFLNQNFPGFEEHAGHKVKVTGELEGHAILVSKIEMAAESE